MTTVAASTTRPGLPPPPPPQRDRERSFGRLLLLAGAASAGVLLLQLHALPRDAAAFFSARRGGFAGDGNGLRGGLTPTRERDRSWIRLLTHESKPYSLGEYASETDYDAATRAAFAASGEEGGTDHVDDTPDLVPYALEDALDESNVWEYTFTVVVYSPDDDAFVCLYHKDHKWRNGNRKLFKAVHHLGYMLRRTFPGRFAGPGSDELVLAVGSGDYPHVKRSMLPRRGGVAPVLMFGSTFLKSDVYPNMMAMPLPESHHLYCFEEFMERGTVCREMQAKKDPGPDGHSDGQLVFGREYGLEWDDLIPQVIWRGTDFGYLHTIQPLPALMHPHSDEFVAKTGWGNKHESTVEAIIAGYDSLLPRWKGVALTADAELEAKNRNPDLPWAHIRYNKLAWADIKFSAYLDGTKAAAFHDPRYAGWESVGIGTDKGKPPSEMAWYKYHIDLAGGGGTTWSGTILKLAMPGLLFHHVTPMKDYIHDRMRPWKHYVPVAPDLKDLRAKFDWAESHPWMARRIADAGTALMRRLGTPEGFGRMFEEDFVEPMRRVIEAYRPVRDVHPGVASWREVLDSIEGCRLLPVMKCAAMGPDDSCSMLGGDDIANWQKVGEVYGGPN